MVHQNQFNTSAFTLDNEIGNVFTADKRQQEKNKIKKTSSLVLNKCFDRRYSDHFFYLFSHLLKKTKTETR